MRVHIYGPNLRDQSKGQFHVHKEGCSDKPPSESEPWTIEVYSHSDAVTALYPIEEFDYEYEDWQDYNDLWFAPCTKGLPIE